MWGNTPHHSARLAPFPNSAERYPSGFWPSIPGRLWFSFLGRTLEPEGQFLMFLTVTLLLMLDLLPERSSAFTWRRCAPSSPSVVSHDVV